MAITSKRTITSKIKYLDDQIRIKEDVKDELNNICENYFLLLSKLSIDNARNSKRNTILLEDLHLAKKQIQSINTFNALNDNTQ